MPFPEAIPSILKPIADGLGSCGQLMNTLLPDAGTAPLRVGIIFRELVGWAAQAPYVEMFANSLCAVAQECGLEIGIVSHRRVDETSPLAARVPGQRWFVPRTMTGVFPLQHAAEFHKLDVVIDLFDVPGAPIPGTGILTWITDFQHFRLPHFFTEAENRARDESFRCRAPVSDFILLSSKAAGEDFFAFMPEAASLAAVAPFPSGLVFHPLPSGGPDEVVRHYHLPEKFLLVANQYWVHKNHRVVLEALGQLLREGLRIPAVLTGMPSDYRDPTNGPTSSLLQGIAELGLAGQVVPVGQIPFSHLVQLMRCATVVVQPSRFEGWSTVIEDAKAIGRPLICSDIPVHTEQAPQALGFFDCDDPSRLAALLRDHWEGLSCGPDIEQEKRSFEIEREFARGHGRAIAHYCRRAFEFARLRLTD